MQSDFICDVVSMSQTVNMGVWGQNWNNVSAAEKEKKKQEQFFVHSNVNK